MLRTIGFFVLVGCAAVAAILIVEALYLNNLVASLASAVFGRLNDAPDLSQAALVGVAVGWAALGLASAVPEWKQASRRTILAWPLRRRPVTSYLIRATAFPLIVALAMMLSVGLFGLWPIIVLIASAAALCGMMLFDVRAVVFPGIDLLAGGGPVNEPQPASGWVLPDTVTLEMLGRPAVRFELARDLRNRAVQMRRFSFVALTGIGALLVVAVCVILFAGFIANLGVGKTGPERIQELLTAETAALDRAQSDLLSNRQKQEDLAKRTTRDPNPDPEAYKSTPEFKQLDVAERKLILVRDAHEDAIGTILRERTAYLKTNIQTDFGSAEEANNLNLLIASGITRFGILFIMLFIVQILVNLYRYTMRLSAYYLSQADALLLASDGEDALLKLVPALSPAQVDFGKAPDTPAQNLEKLLEMAAKLRSVS